MPISYLISDCGYRQTRRNVSLSLFEVFQLPAKEWSPNPGPFVAEPDPQEGSSGSLCPWVGLFVKRTFRCSSGFPDFGVRES